MQLYLRVIICFLLIAVTLKSIIKYSDLDLDWWHALTLGAILSATDPVAVVALLKELGAPVHINTIIETATRKISMLSIRLILILKFKQCDELIL